MPMRCALALPLLGAALLLGPAAAHAQQDEGPGALGAPTARDGSRPAEGEEDTPFPSGPATAPTPDDAPEPGDTAEPSDTAEGGDAAEEGDDLGTIPPPPGAAGYGAPRYPSATGVSGALGDSPDLRIPSRMATRLRVLEGSHQALAARGGNGVVDGVLSLVSGGLVGGIGIWQWSEDAQLGAYLVLWGGANVLRGIVDLALTPNASRSSVAYSHMPMTNMEEVEARLLFGEKALEDLARRSRLAHILDASLNVAVGAAVIPIYLAPNDFALDDPFDYFVIIGSGISIISGIISLATRSSAERRWEAYEQLRDRLTAEEAAALAPETGFRFVGADIAGRRGGAALMLHSVF